MDAWNIEIAAGDSLRACLALLTPINHPDVMVYSARDPAGALVGAAGVLWQSWGDPPGFPAWIHVLPDSRRRGVARALLQQLLDRLEGETAQLWAAMPLMEHEAAAMFCTASGFEADARQLIYDADAATFLRHIEGIVSRLRRSSRVPDEAVIVDLDRDLIPPVTTLIQQELKSAPATIAAMLSRALSENPATAPVDRARSKVLLLGQEVIGALVSQRQPDRMNSRIVCNVVAPEWRRGWANALLLEATTRAGVEANCSRFSFDCDETSRDTIGLAERCQADLIRTQLTFRYAVAGTR